LTLSFFPQYSVGFFFDPLFFFPNFFSAPSNKVLRFPYGLVKSFPLVLGFFRASWGRPGRNSAPPLRFFCPPHTPPFPPTSSLSSPPHLLRAFGFQPFVVLWRWVFLLSISFFYRRHHLGVVFFCLSPLRPLAQGRKPLLFLRPPPFICRSPKKVDPPMFFPVFSAVL